MSYDTIYMVEGELHIKRVNERKLDKLLMELANLLHNAALEHPYGNRYKIMDDECEVDGEDDSNLDDIVPLISGEIDFWCETYNANVRDDVYYIFKDVDGITCKLWRWIQ